MICGMTLPTASVVIANVKNIRHVSQRMRRRSCSSVWLFPLMVPPVANCTPQGNRLHAGIANVCVNDSDAPNALAGVRFFIAAERMHGPIHALLLATGAK